MIFSSLLGSCDSCLQYSPGMRFNFSVMSRKQTKRLMKLKAWTDEIVPELHSLKRVVPEIIVNRREITKPQGFGFGPGRLKLIKEKPRKLNLLNITSRSRCVLKIAVSSILRQVESHLHGLKRLNMFLLEENFQKKTDECHDDSLTLNPPSLSHFVKYILTEKSLY